jgi:glycine/D-amino acid oxidase-like deaminating enzyme
MQKELYDTVVVGAGIVGCSVSYHLAKAGLKVALLDKGRVAGEASQAAAGMLAPLGDEHPDQAHPLQQLAMAALRYYDGLDEQLKQETGMDIGLMKVPTLVLATKDIRSRKRRLGLTSPSAFSLSGGTQPSIEEKNVSHAQEKTGVRVQQTIREDAQRLHERAAKDLFRHEATSWWTSSTSWTLAHVVPLQTAQR